MDTHELKKTVNNIWGRQQKRTIKNTQGKKKTHTQSGFVKFSSSYVLEYLPAYCKTQTLPRLCQTRGEESLP